MVDQSKGLGKFSTRLLEISYNRHLCVLHIHPGRKGRGVVIFGPESPGNFHNKISLTWTWFMRQTSTARLLSHPYWCQEFNRKVSRCIGNLNYTNKPLVYRARSKRKTTEIIPLEDKLVLEPGEGDTFEKFPLQSPLRLRTLQTSKTVNLSRVSAVSNFQIQKSIWNHQWLYWWDYCWRVCIYQLPKRKDPKKTWSREQQGCVTRFGLYVGKQARSHSIAKQHESKS